MTLIVVENEKKPCNLSLKRLSLLSGITIEKAIFLRVVMYHGITILLAHPCSLYHPISIK